MGTELGPLMIGVMVGVLIFVLIEAPIMIVRHLGKIAHNTSKK